MILGMPAEAGDRHMSARMAPPTVVTPRPARVTAPVTRSVGYWPWAWAAGNESWRPCPMTAHLRRALDEEDRAEDRGLDGDDRLTCFTHQSWITDCIQDPSHANPMLDYNWCRLHWSAVQICRCRPATIDGLAPTRPTPQIRSDDQGEHP